MRKIVRFISLFLVAILMVSACLTSCDIFSSTDETLDSSDGSESSESQNKIPEDEYQLPLEEGYNQLTIYFNHNDTYENCDVCSIR